MAPSPNPNPNPNPNPQLPPPDPTDPLSQQVHEVLQAALGALTSRSGPSGPSAATANRLATPSAPTPSYPSTNTGNHPPPDYDSNSPFPYWYHHSINSYNFDLKTYLSTIPHLPKLLKSTQGRRAATEADPILFALTYLPHHLKDPNNPTAPPSFADCHFDWARRALSWAANKNRSTPPAPHEDRNAEIAPRSCGKSTWWFLIIPLWAAAHGHKKFIAAFAATATQAEGHLRTLKNEIDNNKYLKTDFPELTNPKRRPSGSAVADKADSYQAQSGFVFIAKGVDSSNLGMKVEEARPDLLLLDDVEPDEASYSADLALRRLKTIQDSILQLNIYASVVFVGTVTMPNSIIHQIVKFSNGDRSPTLEWVKDENINGHHYLPILNEYTPNERSLWPEKWSLTYLKSIRHTRSYAKNYLNDPRGREGDFWNMEDFTHAPFKPNRHTRTAIFLDPATTSHRRSDPAGIAIVSWNPPTPQEQAQPFEMEAPRITRKSGTIKHRAMNRTIRTHPGTVSVRHASSIRLTGKPLARHVYNLMQQNHHMNIRRLIIEASQGGDLWLEVFADSPVQVEIINPREGKEERFGRALEYYQKIPTLVTHDSDRANNPHLPNPFTQLEEEQMSFPKGAHDDVADAAVSGILYFLEPRPKRKRIRTQVRSYV